MYDETLEAAVIGALLYDNNMSYSLAGEVSARDFYIPIYGLIFSASNKLIVEGRTADPLTVHQVVPEITTDDLITLVENRLSLSATVDYARAIREYAKKRRLESMAKDFLEGLEEKTSTEALTFLSTMLKGEMSTGRIQAAEEIRDRIAKSMDKPKIFFPTGLERLDDVLAGGMYSGYTYGLCGAEKAGKTTIAHTISHNLGMSGCKHLYVAMEMGAEQIEEKNIARDAGFNALLFLRDRKFAHEKMKNHLEIPLNTKYYLDCPGETLEGILYQVMIAKAQKGITGFIIDYWQLVGGKRKEDSEERHFRDVAQGFADFARKNDLWCLLLAQMNKEGQLFGGNGLRKACDCLMMIEQVEGAGMDNARWLRMDASRYTLKLDVGSPTIPGIVIDYKVGPYAR